ncbi:MAG: tetratricopeptide repeat protein [Pseudomonadota bacterium]
MMIPGDPFLAHPERLWLLLPVAVLWFLWYRRRRGPSPWAGIVDPELLSHLNQTAGGNRDRAWLAPPLLALGLVLTVVALAEPRLPGAGDRFYQRTSAVLLVLDLSHPEAPHPALEEALGEWLETTRVPQVGLLATAGTTHEVVPPTPETAMVRRQLQWLRHETMPVSGLNPDEALTRARAVIERTRLRNAAVILIGEGLASEGAPSGAALLAEDGVPVHRVSVDGPGPEGDALAAGTVNAGHWWSAAEFPDQRHPLPRAQSAFTDHTRAGDGPDPSHLGPWLVLLVILLAMPGLRRGWLLALPLLVVPPPLPALDRDDGPLERSVHEDLWRTPDQRAMQFLREGEHTRAAEHFRDPEWRGMALFRAGRYLQAAGVFATVDSARAHYNRGNALVRANRMGEAIAAYETALERDPEHHRAEHNRDRVNKYLDARRSLVRQQQDEAAEGRATRLPGPLLRDDPAEFWKRKFELDLRRRGQ